VGRKLGSLERFGLGLDEKRIAGKKILLCFWSVQQRPSRQMIWQLAERRRELESKKIVVVAVQASQAEGKALIKWLRDNKNKISFPVGVVKKDEEAVRHEWAVKGLPWLILTDEKHVIRSEGFGLDELEEKLKRMSARRAAQSTTKPVRPSVRRTHEPAQGSGRPSRKGTAGIAHFAGAWTGLASDKPGQGTSKDSLSIELEVSSDGKPAGTASGQFVKSGLVKLENVRIAAGRLKFEVIHRTGVRMAAEFRLTQGRLLGDASPIGSDGDACDICLYAVVKGTERVEQDEPGRKPGGVTTRSQ
jgi:hypothetical protein